MAFTEKQLDTLYSVLRLLDGASKDLICLSREIDEIPVSYAHTQNKIQFAYKALKNLLDERKEIKSESTEYKVSKIREMVSEGVPVHHICMRMRMTKQAVEQIIDMEL